MSSTSSSKATSMADLMAGYKGTIVALKKGDNVEGIVTKLSKNEILVDLHSKGEAFVLEKDPRILKNLMASVKEGDTVEVSVLSPESESGQPIVSLRKFLDQKTWAVAEELKKNQKQIDATVMEVTKGGYVLNAANGLSGFLPNSHTSFSQAQSLTAGKVIKVSVADFNKEEQKVIFSQKTTMPLEEFEKVVAVLKSGQKISGKISHVANFGLFVTLHPFTDDQDRSVDGLIHISELAWERTEDIASLFTAGTVVEASVLGFDKDARRVDLSLKRLTLDPFEKLKEAYPVDKKVQGRVVRVEGGNIFVSLGEGVEGMIKKEKVPPTVTYSVDSIVNATVSSLDTRRRRIELVPVLLEKPIGYR